jgi:hypothetical protein
MDAASYNYVGNDTLLGDPGVTIVMGHNGYGGRGSFAELDDAFEANPNGTFPVVSADGKTTYTYEFVAKNSYEHGSYKGVLEDLTSKHPDESILGLQTCPDENSNIIKDVYVARLAEATTSLDFIDANGNQVTIPGTLDVINHEFQSNIGNITLNEDNTLPADFADSITTEVHNLPSEEAAVTSPEDVAQPANETDDIPRRNIWRDNDIQNTIETAGDWAFWGGSGIGGLSAAAASSVGIANSLKANKMAKDKQKKREEEKITENVENFLNEINVGDKVISAEQLKELFDPSNNGGRVYMSQPDSNGRLKLTDDGKQLVRNFISSGAYLKGASPESTGQAFINWFSRSKSTPTTG